MLETLAHSLAEKEQYEQIKRLLVSQNLPEADIGPHISLYTWTHDDEIIGLGGWEQYGKIGLLRSVVISEAHQGKGYGKKWAHELLRIAIRRGIEDAYLLTTTAAPFFERQGFNAVGRSSVPEEIKQTKEFSFLCPDSATIMHRKLDPWSEEDSRVFIEYAEAFIPHRSQQLEMITHLLTSISPLEQVIDLCSGEGVLSEAIARKFSQVKLWAYDGSQEMLDKATERMAPFADRFRSQIILLEKSDWRAPNFEPSAVVSSLAVHHLNAGEKQALFSDIFKMLQPGGICIIADLIQPTRKVGFQLASKAWDGWVKKTTTELWNNTTAYEYFIQDGWNYFDHPDEDPIDQPSSLFDQLKMMEKAGFVDTDVFWMEAGHVLFAGWKPKKT